MGKQRLIQEAILAQADPFTVLTNFQALAASGAKYVKTDIPQGELAMLLDVAIKARQLTPATLELVPPTVDVSDPDFAAIQELVAAAIPED
jgi:anionic cell wall polymer biosynthesis LytR-Cps2A-Psr (LCP) family protein